MPPGLYPSHGQPEVTFGVAQLQDAQCAGKERQSGFIKTLKREEIYASTYRDFEHLRERVEEFIERYYNETRLHSALGYCSPERFEKTSQLESERVPSAAVMTFAV